MSFPSLSPFSTTAQNVVESVNRMWNQIGIFIDAINRKPQLDSIPLSNITLVQGNNQIPHTLGKVLTGWTLTDNTAAATVYRYAASNNTTLFLNASAATTISLVVF